MTAPRRVLFFLCLNDRGGAELSMLRLAQGLKERGIAVTVAVYGAQTGLTPALGFGGDIIDLNVRRTAAALWKLTRLLRARPFDGVISALPYTNIAAALAVALARTKTQLILTEHGTEGVDACRSSILFAAAVRFFYARADAVVVVSQKLADLWRDLLSPRTRVITIYNPVIDDVVPDTTSPLPHPWLADASTPVILGIGRLKLEKNFALLLRAFARVVASRPARLVILGDGEQRPALEKLARDLGIADQILLPGFQARPDAWLAHAALFVSASNREGFGNAIVEALGQGVPVVATDCPCGPREILQDGHYGILVPMNDDAALAQAMIRALAADIDKDALRARARDFTVGRCIDAYGTLVDTQPVSHE